MIYDDQLYKELHRIVTPVLGVIGSRAVAIARQKASGEVVNIRTGDYRRSIRAEVVAGGTSSPLNVRCRVFSDVGYAAVIEYGSKSHEIRARNAPYLVFRVGYSQGTAGVSGVIVRTKKVNHPGTKPTNLIETAVLEAVRSSSSVIALEKARYVI